MPQTAIYTPAGTDVDDPEFFDSCFYLIPEDHLNNTELLQGRFIGGAGFVNDTLTDGGNANAVGTIDPAPVGRGTVNGIRGNSGTANATKNIQQWCVFTMPDGAMTIGFEVYPTQRNWNDVAWNQECIFAFGQANPVAFQFQLVMYSPTEMRLYFNGIGTNGTGELGFARWIFGSGGNPAVPSGQSRVRFKITVSSTGLGEWWVEVPGTLVNGGYVKLTTTIQVQAMLTGHRWTNQGQTAFCLWSKNGAANTGNTQWSVRNFNIIRGKWNPGTAITYYTKNEVDADLNSVVGPAEAWRFGHQQIWEYIYRPSDAWADYGGQGTNVRADYASGGKLVYGDKRAHTMVSFTPDVGNNIVTPSWSAGKTIPVYNDSGVQTGTRVGQTIYFDERPIKRYLDTFVAAGGKYLLMYANGLSELHGGPVSQFRTTLDPNVVTTLSTSYPSTHPSPTVGPDGNSGYEGHADLNIGFLHYVRTNYPQITVVAMKPGPPERDTTGQWDATNADADLWRLVHTFIRAWDNYWATEPTAIGQTPPPLIPIGFAKWIDFSNNATALNAMMASLQAAGLNNRSYIWDAHYLTSTSSMSAWYEVVNRRAAVYGFTQPQRITDLEAFMSDTKMGPKVGALANSYSGAASTTDTYNQLKLYDVPQMSAIEQVHEADCLMILLTESSKFAFRFTSVGNNPTITNWQSYGTYWFYPPHLVDVNNPTHIIETHRMQMHRIAAMIEGSVVTSTCYGNPAYKTVVGKKTSGAFWILGRSGRQRPWTMAGQDQIVYHLGVAKANATAYIYRANRYTANFWSNGAMANVLEYQANQRIAPTLIQADGNGDLTVTGILPTEVFFIEEVVVDVTPPDALTASVDSTGAYLDVAFSEPVSPGTGVTGFQMSGGHALTFAQQTDPTHYRFTITPPVQRTESGLTLAYNASLGNVYDQASSPNPLGNIAALGITNGSLYDSIPPTIVSASINAAGNILTVNFSEPVAPTPAASLLGFSISGPHSLLPGSATGSSATFPIATNNVVSSETITLAYSPGNATDQATPANNLAAVSNVSVTNGSTVPPDATAPTIVSAVVDATGAFLTVTLTEPVTPTGAPTGFSIAGRNLTFLNKPSTASYRFQVTPIFQQNASANLAYAPGNVQDLAIPTANPLAAVGSFAISNGSTVDTVAPTLVSATINAGGTLLTLVFSEPVYPTSGAFGFSILGHSLSSPATSGNQITFAISQVYSDEIPLLNYSPGNVTDRAGTPNPLAAFTSTVVYNGSTAQRPATVTGLSVIPLYTTILANSTLQIAFTVNGSGAVSQQILASINGDNGQMGTVDNLGLYTAPASVPATGLVVSILVKAADNIAFTQTVQITVLPTSGIGDCTPTPWLPLRRELIRVAKTASPLLGTALHPVEVMPYGQRMNWNARIQAGTIKAPSAYIVMGPRNETKYFSSPSNYNYNIASRIYIVISTVNDPNPEATLDAMMFLVHKAIIYSQVIQYVAEPRWLTGDDVDLNQSFFQTGAPFLSACLVVNGVYGWMLSNCLPD